MLSRDDILKQDELPTTEVPVPEWGDGATVRVRGLTSKARFKWARMAGKAAEGEGPEPTAYLVALCAIDKDGGRLFTDQDADALAEMRGDIIDRIATAVMELSGLGKGADAAVLDAEGNSGPTPNEGTSSG